MLSSSLAIPAITSLSPIISASTNVKLSDVEMFGTRYNIAVRIRIKKLLYDIEFINKEIWFSFVKDRIYNN
ncbi:MAG: hypothetical protein Kapaf2KO_21060 [Candidatus Kapaibacteriales bacterium]